MNDIDRVLDAEYKRIVNAAKAAQIQHKRQYSQTLDALLSAFADASPTRREFSVTIVEETELAKFDRTKDACPTQYHLWAIRDFGESIRRHHKCLITHGRVDNPLNERHPDDCYAYSEYVGESYVVTVTFD